MNIGQERQVGKKTKKTDTVKLSFTGAHFKADWANSSLKKSGLIANIQITANILMGQKVVCHIGDNALILSGCALGVLHCK